jgi:hypothetical protein
VVAGGTDPAGATTEARARLERDRLLAVNVEGLTDDDFAGLLDGLADLEAVPASDPLPVMPVESVAAGSGGDD